MRAPRILATPTDHGLLDHPDPAIARGVHSAAAKATGMFSQLHALSYEDLVQHGYAAVATSIGKFDASRGANLATFVHQIAWRRLHDLSESLRRDARRSTLIAVADERSPMPAVAAVDESLIETQAWLEEQVERLRERFAGQGRPSRRGRRGFPRWQRLGVVLLMLRRGLSAASTVDLLIRDSHLREALRLKRIPTARAVNLWHRKSRAGNN